MDGRTTLVIEIKTHWDDMKAGDAGMKVLESYAGPYASCHSILIVIAGLRELSPEDRARHRRRPRDRCLLLRSAFGAALAMRSFSHMREHNRISFPSGANCRFNR